MHHTTGRVSSNLNVKRRDITSQLIDSCQQNISVFFGIQQILLRTNINSFKDIVKVGIGGITLIGHSFDVAIVNKVFGVRNPMALCRQIAITVDSNITNTALQLLTTKSSQIVSDMVHHTLEILARESCSNSFVHLTNGFITSTFIFKTSSKALTHFTIMIDSLTHLYKTTFCNEAASVRHGIIFFDKSQRISNLQCVFVHQRQFVVG